MKSKKQRSIILGVTGSIAAYKAAELASLLVKQGHDVHVVMTKEATDFINADKRQGAEIYLKVSGDK